MKGARENKRTEMNYKIKTKFLYKVEGYENDILILLHIFIKFDKHVPYITGSPSLLVKIYSEVMYRQHSVSSKFPEPI